MGTVIFVAGYRCQLSNVEPGRYVQDVRCTNGRRGITFRIAFD